MRFIWYMLFIWFIFVNFILTWNEEKIIVFCFLSAFFFIVFFFGNSISNLYVRRIVLMKDEFNILLNSQLFLLESYISDMSKFILNYYNMIEILISNIFLVLLNTIYTKNLNIFSLLSFAKSKELDFYFFNWYLNNLFSIFLNIYVFNNKYLFSYTKYKTLAALNYNRSKTLR